MTQKDNESFKEYVERLREVASKVKPSLSERELDDLFMDTVQHVFYDKIVGNVSANFFDLVIMGIIIEHGMNNGNMVIIVETSNNNAKKFPGGF